MDDELIKSEITKRWSKGADRYDTYVSHGVQTETEKNLWITAFLKALPLGIKNLKILDVGCGTGAMGLILADMGHQVTGIDLCEDMMDKGRKKAADTTLPMVFQTGDAENPPFSENSFDVVVSRHLLWTLPHPQEALSAWVRIIRPGGRILAIDGIWDDKKTISRIRRRLSQTLGTLFSPEPPEKNDYSTSVREHLPHMGGVPEDVAKSYFTKAGLDPVIIEDLIHIRKNQHTRLAWYEKMRPTGSYYLIYGVKRE